MSIVTDPFSSAKRYQIIVADPPWTYKDRAVSGRRGAAFKYDCMSMADIRSLPVWKISHYPSCVLFMWATAPMLPDALETMRQWRFKFKTVAFVWVKNRNGVWFKGMGNYTRANAEFVLLGTIGKIPARVSKSVSQIVCCPRMEHSRKPDQVLDRVAELYGDVPRIELFARRQYPGWDAWGKEL